MNPPGKQPPEQSPTVESPPPLAARVFGGALPAAERYVALLAGPGVTRGLLGPREPSRLWTRHLLNCAPVAEFVPVGCDVVDVGSGAGLPGIPLALLRPDLGVTLLEPMARRAAFLREVVAELDLAGRVHVRRGRADDVSAKSADAVVARAVAPLGRLLTMTLPMLRAGGRLIALKGSNAAVEIEESKGVLADWPAATVSIVRTPASATGTTLVIVALDAGQQRAEDA